MMTMMMTECSEPVVSFLSWTLVVMAPVLVLGQTRSGAPYGRYAAADRRCCPAPLAWCLQEAPSFLLPLLLLLLLPGDSGARGPRGDRGRTLLVWTFMLHYFHRAFIYALLTRGRPVPLHIVASAAIFCSLNGFLQGHHLLHCAHFDDTWLTHARLAAGFLVFLVGMTINIHSDHVLRSLRRPGETSYRIPYGGMFEFVSGANFFGEIVEWCGYALAAWSFPTFAFMMFTICSVGPRAYQHHRYYQKRFEDYPRSRKAVIPFIL